MNNLELHLALARCAFLSAVEKSSLSKKLDNLESLTVLSIEEIGYLIGRCINSTTWKPEQLLDEVSKDVKLMSMFGIKLVTFDSQEYPPQLREIHDPPYSLFWRGLLPDPEKPLVSIVGTRSPSGDGAIHASRLAAQFADAGVSVVSGMARGIDAFAHRGAIDGGGKTVAVLACGVDRIYPSSNKVLAGRIIDCGGCIISEYSPGEFPLKFRFPQRNRIISGLSRSVIVVEAPARSGALITADFALDQGRDLYVGKPALHSARSEGVRLLHSQGAQAISSAHEVLSTWANESIQYRSSSAPVYSKPATAKAAGLQLAFEFRTQMALPARGHEEYR